MALIGVLLLLGIALLIPLTAVVLDSQVGRAIASRLEGEKDQAGTLPGRVASLESDVDRLNQMVQRLEEEAQFLQRLLEERPAPEGLLPPGDGQS
jgi:TolA-binding protein